MPHVTRGESDLLEAVLNRYEAEGFEVYTQPSASVLPAFMKGFRPDAIAVKGPKKIAFEIKYSSSGSATLKEIQKLFSEHPDWELNVLYLSPRASTALSTISRNAIAQTITEVEQLRLAGQYSAALMLGWSALEATARSILPERLDRPQPPGSLVEALANEGLLTPSEAPIVRRIASTRNAVAHGQLYPNPAPKRIDELISVLHTLSDMLPRDAAQ
jgi:uncharacterized protein YutE (UPF0331/DUF86 family)